ncbi:ethanolamine ammonia-lyase reactivating factor EutA [Haloferax profundi]|uniref:Ethanolamine ammonia lyase-activating protein n=1 Tax=Haloferax profundi TaxID=1544718 RepID=A0A0W1RQG5_9EURY|nr:ethanolamine ammonia-lyase reactivating factor EutA [Haloferax profundi]KTG15857.1 hypothetical protein AUR66_18725 [Haloferax profundi]
MQIGDANVLTSIGIDIGTTTIQLVVSHLHFDSPTVGSNAVEVTEREIVHRGAVQETPLSDRTTIDTEAVKRYVTTELEAINYSPKDIDTGAVIVTGESSYKENAKQLVHSLAEEVGDFVIATAGPSLEAVLAGKGSGAAEYAQSTGKTIANIDIGGGTTNIGIFTGDEVTETRCLDVGGRLIQFDKDGAVAQISPPAAKLINDQNLDIREGALPDESALGKLVRTMGKMVLDIISGQSVSPRTQSFVIGNLSPRSIDIDHVVFSGGVGKLLNTPSGTTNMLSPSFNDIGPLLAKTVNDQFQSSVFDVIRLTEDINATVIGAGTRSTELSGTTIKVDDSLLPLRNIPLYETPSLERASTSTEMLSVLQKATESAHQLYEAEDQQYGLFLPSIGELSFERISSLAEVFVKVYQSNYESGDTLIIVAEQNCAKVLAQRVTAQSSVPIPLVVIDEIHPQDGDYLDIGEPILRGRTVPIVIKSLTFGN